MLDLKIIPNVNNNSDLYIFFCEKNFSFNPKKLSKTTTYPFPSLLILKMN